MISDNHNSTGLQHSLKQRHMSMIAIGGVIGAGLFVGSGVIAKAAGPAAILSFLLTGGLVVLIMRMLGELASSLPVVGSFYEYARLAFDDKPKVSKFLGFMSGWMYWYFWVVVVALEAIAGAKLVNFWLPDVPSWSISLVLDTPTASFTAVIGRMPEPAETHEGLYHRALAGKPLTSVQVDFLHGSLDRPWQDGHCLHAPTDELVGLRNHYRYSPSEVYEHIYLNPRFYAWQCLEGVEKGLCDTDRCHYYKIAEQLYLFVWQEKIVPTLGLVLIDLQQHRSDGKIFGYAGASFDALSNFPISSYCQVLNRTEYPRD